MAKRSAAVAAAGSKRAAALAFVREALDAGKRVSPKEVGAAIDAGPTETLVAVRTLAAEGYRIVRDRESPPGGRGGAMSYYRLAAEGEPATDFNEPLRAPSAKEAARRAGRYGGDPSIAPALVSRRRPAGVELPAMPALGSTLTVRWLRLEDSGAIAIGLANGAHVWNAVIDAVAER